MRRGLRNKGQSTLEYVIVLTAIVAAILFAAVQFMRPSLNQVYRQSGRSMNGSGNLFVRAIGGGALNITP